jgi:hypothetical protein
MMPKKELMDALFLWNLFRQKCPQLSRVGSEVDYEEQMFP